MEGELAADGNTQKHDDAVRLLEVIKNEPTLKKHGAHYMVPREFSGNRLTKQTLEAPLEVEVRHEVSPGKFQWLKLKIVDHNYEGQTPEERPTSRSGSRRARRARRTAECARTWARSSRCRWAGAKRWP